jgi:transporter family protein
MTDWLSLSIGALLTWGVWGIFGKMASKYLDGQSLFFYQLVTGLLVIGIAFTVTGFRPDMQNKTGIAWAVATGVASAVGQILYFSALGKGKASIVVLMTGLYPVITVILAFLVLREAISWTQGLGIFFAVVAMGLLSI